MKKVITTYNGGSASPPSPVFSFTDTWLGRFFAETGGLARFTGAFFLPPFPFPYEFREFLRQSYAAGYRSVQLVGITGFIMGLVMSIQSRPTLAEFGAESWLPGMVAISIVREIGPVITALICAGKIGSGIGAELASMRITEQIDAMEVAGNDPFKYVVATRVLAVTLMVPLLVIFADAISIFGSWVAVNITGDVSFRLFFAEVFDNVAFYDVFPATIKTFFFGLAIGIVSCYKGYYANKGTEGVGEASNQAVVLSSLLIFIIDMIAVQITSLFPAYE
jgi:phospholipid/cholesterol/gamma-HCH transport system permease protein